MTNLLILISAILGLAVGSFMNVVIYRTPNGLSVVRPASSCPKCSARIRWYDNVPLLSWMLLRGRCRNCCVAISIVYPTVELATGLLFALTTAFSIGYWNSDTAILMLSGLVAYLALLWLVATGVGLAVIDFKSRLLPRALIYPLYAVGISALCLSSFLSMDFMAIFRAGAGGLGLGTFYSLVFVLVPGGLGWGDVTLAGILAFYLAWIGWGALILGALLAFAFGAGFGLLLMVIGKAKGGHKIAFGPWMLLGALFGGIWGNSAWGSYLEYLSRFIS